MRVPPAGVSANAATGGLSAKKARGIRRIPHPVRESSPAATADPDKRGAVTQPDWYSQWLGASEAVGRRQVFFVLGCQKSGTTWLQHLLNAHPQVCCGGEGHVVDLLAPLLQQAVSTYNERQAQRRAVGLEVLLTSLDLLGLARALADRILSGYLPSQDASATTQIRAVGDKSPENALSLPMLNQLYPDARFIHIVRDGRDACISGWFHLQRQGKADRFNALAAYAAYFAEHHWSKYIESARSAAAQLPGRYVEVRYERLHTDATGETGRILELLGVDASPAAVRTCVEGGAFEKHSGGRRAGQEDASSFYRKGVVGDWRGHFDEAAAASFAQNAGRLLQTLGYADAVPAGPASVGATDLAAGIQAVGA
jgi:hypothetical protein